MLKGKTIIKITEEDIDIITDRIGMAPGGWDMVDHKELIEIIVKHFKDRP